MEGKEGKGKEEKKERMEQEVEGKEWRRNKKWRIRIGGVGVRSEGREVSRSGG